MHRIIGNIYLGSLADVEQAELAKNQITHVLSVISGPAPEIPREITSLQVLINDDSSSNILAIMAECHEFMNNCLFNGAVANPKNPHHGSVLVHCHEGLSRSPTVIAAYLIRYYRLKLDQALYAIKRKAGELNINEGFMEQLKIWENCKGELNNDLYKEFLVKLNGGEAKEAYKQFAEHQNEKEEEEVQGFVRCKICREPFAKSSQLLSHVKPEDTSRQKIFRSKHAKASEDCSHYFLKDPLKWMNLQEEIEGKFNCTKCHAKIGGYSWKGTRCSCGKWIIPSFHLLTSKVEFVPSKPYNS